MPDSLADRLRSLLASDVYSAKGRLRSDDQLVRERVGRALSESAAAVRALVSSWRLDRVPPSTRQQPFPPAEVMAPIRQAERLVREIDDVATKVKGLPVLSSDKVWDRVRQVGLEDLIQFDWTMVGESDLLASDLSAAAALDELDVLALQGRVRRISQIVSERQRFLEIQY